MKMFVIILTVVLVMPQNVKDIEQSHEMPTIKECMRAASDWLSQDVKKSGGVALMAGCSVSPIAGVDG